MSTESNTQNKINSIVGKNIRNMVSKFISHIIDEISILDPDLFDEIPGSGDYHATFLKSWIDGYEENIKDELKDITKDIITKKKKRKRRVKDPTAPKRAMTSYIFFCTTKRKEVKEELEKADDDFSAKAVTVALGKKWKELKQEVEDGSATAKVELEKYTQMNIEDKKRYKNQMEDHVPMSDDEIESFKKKKTKKKGRKRSRSAWNFFCNNNRESVKETNPDMKAKEIMSELGRLWKILKASEDEDEIDELIKYKDMAHKEKESFDSDESSGDESEVEAEEKKIEEDTSSEEDDIVEEERDVDEVLEEITKPKVKKIKKTKKTKKSSAYLLFFKDHKKELKKENASIKSAEIKKSALETWADFDAEDKKFWELKAKGLEVAS
jgi:hypothetical protein